MLNEVFSSVWAALTESHSGWPINNGNLFIRALEAGKPTIKALADSVSGEDLLPGSQMATFLRHMKRWGLSGVSLIRPLISLMRIPLS